MLGTEVPLFLGRCVIQAWATAEKPELLEGLGAGTGLLWDAPMSLILCLRARPEGIKRGPSKNVDN